MASPMAAQAKLFLSYYAKLGPMIIKFIDENRIADAVQKPTTFLECLSFIVSASVACQALRTGLEGDNARKGIESIDDAAFDLLAEGEMQEMLRVAKLNDEQSSQYMMEQSFKPHPDINLVDVKGLIVATRAQIVSRSSGLSAASAGGRSRAWDGWVKLTEETIEVLKNRLLTLEEVLVRVFPAETISE